MTLEAQIRQGLARAGYALPAAAPDLLLQYSALLQKWNRTYNLTAIREPQKLVSHHLLDSLSIAPHLPAGSLVDVGSGAGLPGIPLAIAQPQRLIALLESNHKKGAFLRQVVIELRLENVQVQIERAESFRPTALFDIAVSRAFADLAGFADAAGRLVRPGGLLAAMKGVYPDEELAQLPSPSVVEQVIEIPVPGLRAARHLVLFRLTSEAESAA